MELIDGEPITKAGVPYSGLLNGFNLAKLTGVGDEASGIKPPGFTRKMGTDTSPRLAILRLPFIKMIKNALRQRQIWLRIIATLLGSTLTNFAEDHRDGSPSGVQRASLDVVWPQPAGSPVASLIVHRTDRNALIEVPTLNGLEMDLIAGKALVHEGEPFPPRMAYQGIQRGQSLVLIEFLPTEEAAQDPALQEQPLVIRLSWQPSLEPSKQLTPKPEGSSTLNRRSGLRRLDQHTDPELTDQPPTLRLPITEEGIYELSYSAIAEGFGTSLADLDPSQLSLTLFDAPYPFEPIQESPDSLKPTDKILFYGLGKFNDYTKTNMFYLSQSDSNRHLIVHTDASPQPEHPTPLHFPTTIHAEEDLHIWQTMARGEGLDHWFWGDKLTAPDSRTYQISTPFPAPDNREITVRTALHGLTFSSLVHPDHQAKLSINDVNVGEILWDDRSPVLLTANFPLELLKADMNNVTIGAPGLPGVVVDQFFINWFEFDYNRLYQASNNTLRFGAPQTGWHTFDVGGISTPDLDVFDVTQPFNTTRLTNFETGLEPLPGNLRLSAEARYGADFLVQPITQRRTISEVQVDIPSAWRHPSNGADYIVIYHEEFTEAAHRLAEHRQSTNLRTAVVQIEDIYDEFSYGEFNPQAIQDFLTYAYRNWEAPALEYIVILGDAYLDYHDNLKTGTLNYVPSQQIDTELIGLTVSDTWLAQVDGQDLFPDVSIGRIPASTKEEANRVVDHIIRYETEPQEGEWRNRLAVIADDEEPGFEELSEVIAEFAAPNLSTRRWFAGKPESAMGQNINQVFDEGYLMINYTGHGTIGSWGLGSGGNILFDRDHAATVDPVGKWPIVTVANCLNGFFAARSTSTCLAETLLLSEPGGAIAVWAPTSLGFPAGHHIIMTEFYRQVLREGQTTLGKATMAAQTAALVQDPVWLELLETYVLFGDPAMQISIGTAPPAAEVSSLSIHVIAPNQLEFRFEATSGYDYVLVATETLSENPAWTRISRSPDSPGVFRVTTDPARPNRFYRVEPATSAAASQ